MIDELIGKLNFDGIDAYLILSSGNRYYFSRKTVSSGAVILTPKARIYISDSRYETYLNEDPAGFDIVMAKRTELARFWFWQTTPMIATGGLSQFLQSTANVFHTIDKTLTLEGLYMLYKESRGSL